MYWLRLPVPNQDFQRLNPVGSQCLVPSLLNLCSVSVGGMRCSDPVEDYNTCCPSSIIVRMEYLFSFQFWYCELCVEIQGRKVESIVLFIFVFWQCFLIVGKRGVVGWDKKSYLEPTEIESFSSRDVPAEAISMTHSGMLYRWDISTFYLYEPFLFQIFVPRKFTKL